MAFDCTSLHQFLGVALLIVLLIVRPSNSAGSSKTNEVATGATATAHISDVALNRSVQHESWMRTYRRTYPNDTVKEERLKIFAKNANFIDSFNKEKRKFALKPNNFTDMTNEEFTDFYTNSRPSQYYFRHVKPQPSPANHSNRHSNSIDWRYKGAVTGVKNQKECGSCWAFATVASIEGIIQIKTGKLTALSEQELVDCVPPREGHKSCDGGSVTSAFKFVIHHNGSLTAEDNYPYTGVSGACNFTLNSASLTQASGVTIKGFKPVNNDETELLKAVARQPVTVSVAINTTILQSYDAGVLTEIGCGTDINHSMTLVGYDSTENGIDYWLLKNSYGLHWGDNGYIKMARGVNGGICRITEEAFYPVID